MFLKKRRNLLVMFIDFKALACTIFLLTVNLFYNGKGEADTAPRTPKLRPRKKYRGKHKPLTGARCILQARPRATRSSLQSSMESTLYDLSDQTVCDTHKMCE